MASKGNRKSLADKISSLITTTPANFGSDEEPEDTKAKVVERYDESDNSDDNLRHSKIRRQNVDLLDEFDNRYAGKKVSRRDIQNDSDENSENGESTGDMEEEESDSIEEESNDDDDELENEEDSDDNLDNEQSSNEANSEQSLDKSEDESDIEDEGDRDIGNPLYRDRRADPKFKTMSDTNVRADIYKGNCVRSQLKLWETLLEMRIKLQKCLITSNQMPQYDAYKDYRTEKEFVGKSNETSSKLKNLLNNMLQLQSSLLRRYPETKNLSVNNKKRKMDDENDEMIDENDTMDEEIPSDTEDEEEVTENASTSKENVTKECDKGVPKKKLKLVDYEKILEDNHRAYEEYRNFVIQKWNEKTRIGTGSLNKGMNQTTLKQIEFALSDKPKLRKKTQLKRSEYKILGKSETTESDDDGRRNQEHDSEIYDDDDFYHQLLRDLIEYKASDVTDSIQLSKRWIQLQNMRSKMKRKIDTRATKGRRIRYNVHNKLINFMAPIIVNDVWTDHAKNELCNSLFGKIKTTDEEISH